jgi:hypothetical protein
MRGRTFLASVGAGAASTSTGKSATVSDRRLEESPDRDTILAD